jgi:hypothetical protein
MSGLTTNSLAEFKWRICRSYPSGMRYASEDLETIQKFSKGMGTSSWEIVVF